MFTKKMFHFEILILIFVAVSIGLFAFSSVYDLEISNYLSQNMQYVWVKHMVAFFDELGYQSPFILIFILSSVFIVGWLSLLKKTQTTNKFKIFMANNSLVIYITWFSLWVIGMSTFTIVFAIQIPTRDNGFGPGNDAKLLGDSMIRMPWHLLMSVINFTIIGYTYKWAQRNLNTNSYSKDIMNIEKSSKLAAQIFFSFMIVYILKTLFGRPVYFSVIYNSHEFSGNYPTMQEIMNYLNLNGANWDSNASTSGIIYKQVDYLAWYQPNNIGKYWWRLFWPVDFTNDPNGDQYWQQAFPSGHTNAIICGFTTVYFVENKKVRDVLATIIFISIIGMNLNLIIMRFHWATDVFFSNISSFSVWFLINYLFNKHTKMIHLSIRKNVIKQEHKLIELENNILRYEFIDNEVVELTKRKSA
ncbi:phosphatase PAP2 family protein [Spiroplasma culicicola]|uniref:Phosphatidic acid phosphatase type 2/haloperoxidase domain-containing protein n=1 Tax=Spiroplasma culicicola AES-1 TaxID=1276246 RepID=W6A8I5_9MOLU|nr:phosphatase PAP2 family protein [Spiroplasma culicicola]AHI53327.1 hypothetical protein SCULI_v1c09870 [Spiroplasma culicicola AES-1]